MSATGTVEKELLALGDGYRESEASWREVLPMEAAVYRSPPIWPPAMGLGILESTSPSFRHDLHGQRCWVHKTANVLNKLPKSQQPKAKAALQSGMAATDEAGARLNQFLTLYPSSILQSCGVFGKNGGHCWPSTIFRPSTGSHLRTTNPIESTFATVRLRTNKTRGCVLEKAFWRWYPCGKKCQRRRNLSRIPTWLRSWEWFSSKTAYGKTPKESPPNLAPYTTFDYFSGPLMSRR